ncbi:unnamed protein product [Brachionus calyciflorus]|uniref:UPAR/Ly6 domain-containing protein n=1 Tax=Brachionus calyciflorus TaxID=104777 RepID=A0A813NQX3_9BILA|nr:unnamed protein product [Brachionus calyciflorus]
MKNFTIENFLKFLASLYVLILVSMQVEALTCYKCEKCLGSTVIDPEVPILETCQPDSKFCVRQVLRTKLTENMHLTNVFMGCSQTCKNDFISIDNATSTKNLCCETDECNLDFTLDYAY